MKWVEGALQQLLNYELRGTIVSVAQLYYNYHPKCTEWHNYQMVELFYSKRDRRTTKMERPPSHIKYITLFCCNFYYD